MSFSIHTAKLDRELLRDFVRKNLDISKTAFNLILHLTPYVDRDGRIHLDKAIKANTYYDRQSIKKAFNELCETTYNDKKLISYEDGYYVSNFHVATSGKLTYLKHLPIFNSPEFLNLTLNQTRLLMYIATNNVRNQYTAVAIENLYKNTLHDPEYGLNIYHSSKSMRDDLFYLIDMGFVHVRLHGEDSELDKTDSTYKKHFNDYCEFKNEKKARTSKYKKNNHVIGLKVNPALFEKDAIANEASKAEIRLLCDRYHMFHEDLKPETFNYITGKKNEMIELFGEAGFSLYRNALEKYFKEKHEFIVYYDQLKKAANHFTDFYLLEEIKMVILAALKFELGSRGELTATGYPISEVHIPSLVRYFIANSSDEHKVLIDQDIQLIKDADDLMSGINADEPWTHLADSITAVYAAHTPTVREIFFEKCWKTGINNPQAVFERVDAKEFVLSLAKKALLSQQKSLDDEARKIKQIVRFFRKKSIPLIPDPYLIKEDDKQEAVYHPVHNWLKE